MKKLVLLLTLVSVSVTFARPNATTNVIFGGSFGGASYVDNIYSVPVGSEAWAGFANEDTSFYPIIMQSGATITFEAATETASDATVYVKFERLPYNAEGNGAADTEPAYATDNVVVSGSGTNTYSITVPSQGANTFSSFLFYNLTFGENVFMTNFILSGLDDGDTTAPTPAQSSFSSAPAAISDSAISMTATTATDADNAVLYYFACTTDSSFDSGWVSDATYVASGLSSATTYEFTVQARDDSYAENTTTVSAAASATTTGADNAAPSPNPSTGSVDASPVTIQITADGATDAFTC